jgi:hypothetical protein
MQPQITHDTAIRHPTPTNHDIAHDIEEPLTLPEGVLDTPDVALTIGAAVGLEAVDSLVSFATAPDLQQVPVLVAVADVNPVSSIPPSSGSVPSSPAISPSKLPSIPSICFSSTAGSSCC